jgi:hypothetical protein
MMARGGSIPGVDNEVLQEMTMLGIDGRYKEQDISRIAEETVWLRRSRRAKEAWARRKQQAGKA